MLQGTKSIRLILILTVLVINVFVIAVVVYMLEAAKEQKEREVSTSLENLAQLLDHSVSSSAERIEFALNETADELQRALRQHGRLDSQEVNALLAARREWLSGIADFRVTDAAGNVAYGAGVAERVSGVQASYADQAFFIEHRRRADSGLIITNPIFSRVSKSWVIAFTRRYNFPDGRFAGIVSAALPVSYFAHLLSGLDLGPHGVALLRDADSALIVRQPPDSLARHQLGAKEFSRELAGLIASGVTTRTYHLDPAPDGTEHINTYRRLSAVPFHLVAGEGADDYLAEWRLSVEKDIALAVIFIATTALLAWLVWRSIVQTEKANTHCRLLLQHASDGIHIINAKGNLIEASDAFFRMLGYTRSELIGMNVQQWDAKVPPEALARSIAQAAEQRRITMLESRHRRKDGTLFDVEIASYPVDLDGQTVLYASARDITERKRAEQELRIAAVAFESRQGMVVTGADSTIIRVNRTFTELTGYQPAEVVGKSPNLFKSGRHDADFYAAMWRAIQQDGFWQGEIWNRRKSGEIYPEWLTITAVRDPEGAITHYVASFWDITRRVEDETAIRNLAFYDPLTGLANRRLLTDRLRQALAKSARSGSYGALLFIDLDRFKALNDTLGHAQGDRLLELVADRLTVNVREGDTVARFGGDEFVVLLEDLDSECNGAADKALIIAEKLRAVLDVPYRLEATRTEDWRCSSSIGVSLFGGYVDELKIVMARADEALYAAKGAGRNKVCIAVRAGREPVSEDMA